MVGYGYDYPVHHALGPRTRFAFMPAGSLGNLGALGEKIPRHSRHNDIFLRTGLGLCRPRRPINMLETPRAPIEEMVRFVGFSD